MNTSDKNWPERYMMWGALNGGTTDFMNCWSFVRKVLHSETGVIIPHHTSLIEVEKAALLIVEKEVSSGRWLNVEWPTTYDLALFIIGRSKLHIGVMVDSFRVLHYKDGKTGAVVEILKHSLLANHLSGYYRHVD